MSLSSMNNTSLNPPMIFSMYGIPAVQVTNAVGIVGNLLLIFAHIKDPLRLLKFPSSLFIYNIAVVDLLLSCALFLLYTPTVRVVLNIANTLVATLHFLAFILYLSLAIERYCLVAFPFWHRINITLPVCRYWMASTWLVSVIPSVGLVMKGIMTELVIPVEIAFLAVIWLLFILIQGTYMASYISLRKQNNELQRREDMNEVTERRLKLRLKSENDFLFTIAIVCFVLAVTILPFYTIASMYFLKAAAKSEKTYTKDPPSSFFWSMVGISANSAINIFVYLWRLPQYRKTFKSLYCQCRKS